MKLLPGESAEDFEADERIKAALEPYVDPSALRIWRSAVYRFHALVAKQWRHSRVFLLGDAAHQTPPFMGQGMCSGVRDAANLAWKINLVNSDGCNETLLDSYQTELLPHVTELIGVTKQLGLIIGELDMVAARHRDRELHRQASDASVPKTRSGFVPPLRTGLIDLDAAGTPTPLAGTLFVQPRVLAPDTSESYLLEDLLQRRFLIVTRGSMPQSWLRKRDLDLWSKLRGERVAIGAPEDRSRPTCDHLVLIELDSVFQSWIESVGAAAVIVRPDRYVYGAARSSTDLHRLLDHLANELIGPRP